MKNKTSKSFRNVFWGVFLLCSAAVIVANQLGYFANISLLSIILTIALVSIIIQSLVKLEFIGVMIPLAFIVIIYAKQFNLEAIVPWPVLVAAVFAGAGLNMLVKSKRRKSWYSEGWEFGDSHGTKFRETIENMDDNIIYNKVSFGAETKYIHSNDFKQAEFKCSFGALKVFLDQATSSSDGAFIDVDCSFGSIVMYVPRHWEVKDKTSVSLGNVRFLNRPETNESSPKLTITGSVQFGSVDIHYV